MKKLNAADLEAKIEWEGGLFPTMEYGIIGDDIEDEEIAELWDRVLIKYEGIRNLWTRLEELITDKANEIYDAEATSN